MRVHSANGLEWCGELAAARGQTRRFLVLVVLVVVGELWAVPRAGSLF